jgi:hypothetical protein
LEQTYAPQVRLGLTCCHNLGNNEFSAFVHLVDARGGQIDGKPHQRRQAAQENPD